MNGKHIANYIKAARTIEAHLTDIMLPLRVHVSIYTSLTSRVSINDINPLTPQIVHNSLYILKNRKFRQNYG